MAGSGRRLAALTLDNVSDVSEPCRGCRFWTLGPTAMTRERSGHDEGTALDDWLGDTLLQWGSCGQIAYAAGDPVAHVLYAPPAYLPGAGAFATSPAAPEAVLMARLRIREDHRGAGLGRVLVQAMASDLVRREVGVIEAFGWRARPVDCLVPAEFLLAVGFRTVRGHASTPRLRLELKSTSTWREGVGSAWGSVVASLRARGAATQWQ